ncbi:hypothetical protein W97_00652 [Coniosporium apollinis CBS 100218]|uniref:Uncharacterized protein n=1 Tax=Coniosporium apollinis (strain CBS 100218) TaxID=1168221 RepID=R7YHQ2_CONA1|nr:uncharacterized protein W97_00652 [Coniosporium apollinis CBS 100218]EON61437.1 hypothetical protein W97_00652 [Coniosporium apollinis CBS 100218]
MMGSRSAAVARVIAAVKRQAEGSVEDFSLEVFLTKAKYAERLEVLTEAWPDDLQDSYQEAVKQEIIPAVGNLNGKHLYAWAADARAKRSSDEVPERQAWEEVREVKANKTAVDETRINAFEMVCSQYKMEKSAMVKLYEDFMKDLLSKIETMKTEALSNLSNSFSVVTDYSADSEEEVYEKCWGKFVSQKGLVSRDDSVLTESNLEKAIKKFEQQVRNEQKAAYLRDPKRVKQLDELTSKLATPFRAEEVTKLNDALVAAARRGTAAQVPCLEPTSSHSELSTSFDDRIPSVSNTGSTKPMSTQVRGEKRHRELDSHSDGESRDRRRHRGSERSRSPRNDSNEATPSAAPVASPAPQASQSSRLARAASMTASPAPFMSPETQKVDFGKIWTPTNSALRDPALPGLASLGSNKSLVPAFLRSTDEHQDGKAD